MRRKRNKLQFDEESVNKLLQEIYEESHNIKAKITRLFTKWETKIKETGEVQAIGDQIVKLIAAEAKNQDQKIMLLRYLKEVVFDTKSTNDEKSAADDTTSTISTDRRNELMNFVREQIENKEKEKNKNR